MLIICRPGKINKLILLYHKINIFSLFSDFFIISLMMRYPERWFFFDFLVFNEIKIDKRIMVCIWNLQMPVYLHFRNITEKWLDSVYILKPDFHHNSIEVNAAISPFFSYVFQINSFDKFVSNQKFLHEWITKIINNSF